MKTALTVCDTAICQHESLYSLNDLHRAAGGEERHKPANFMRLDQTQALVAEIARCSDMSIIPTKTVTGRGKQQGTYVCKELVYAYAMWISPKFHLQVIRAYDALMVSGPVFRVPKSFHEALQLAANLEEQRQALAKKIEDDAPKVEFYETVEKSQSTYSINEAAKVLGLGEMKLRDELKRRGYFQKNGRIPLQVYVNSGLFEVSIRTWKNNMGYPMTYAVPLVTGKGIIVLRKVLGISPSPQLRLENLDNTTGSRFISQLRGKYYRGSATDRVMSVLKDAKAPMTNGELMAQAGCTRGETAWALRILDRDGFIVNQQANIPGKNRLYKRYYLKHNGNERHHTNS